MKRVRFAPSPTGSLHVGNALSAFGNRELGRHAIETSGSLRALTLTRFRELRERANGGFDHDAAKSLVRELKAVGGDLRVLRLALTGRDRGPELAAVIAALDGEETMRRLDAAL